VLARTGDERPSCPAGDPLAGSLLPVRRAGVGEAVEVGAGFDDGAVVGESVHDGGAQAGVGEGVGPPGAWKSARQSVGRLLDNSI